MNKEHYYYCKLVLIDGKKHAIFYEAKRAIESLIPIRSRDLIREMFIYNARGYGVKFKE